MKPLSHYLLPVLYTPIGTGLGALLCYVTHVRISWLLFAAVTLMLMAVKGARGWREHRQEARVAALRP